MQSSNNHFLASAVLAVYNSEKTVIAALTTLLLQTVPIEIIIVDDGSTDSTLSQIKTLAKSHGDIIRLFSQPHLGPATARNLGAAQANSKILLFVDADMTFESNYVETLIDPILKNEVKGTYSVRELVANWQSPLARCWNIQEGWADKLRFPPSPPKYGTDYRAILKSEFDRVGGFDDTGYTDTWSLFNKLGVKPLATQAACYHKNPDTLAAVYRQARWAAKRPYKHGSLGLLFALIRTSLPVSVCIGLYKSIRYQNLQFFFFKLVFDFGRFVGILEMLSTGKLSK